MAILALRQNIFAELFLAELCKARVIIARNNFRRVSCVRMSEVRERPPVLIQHVLTVLVFWSWMLLMPRLLPSSRSIRLLPWASILLHRPLDTCLDLPPSPTTRAKTERTAQVFTARGGHTPV